MNYTPFVWPSVLAKGLLIEAPGKGAMTLIDPDDIAAVGVKALTEDGHEGKTYELTAEDSFSTAKFAEILRGALGRDIRLFEGDLEALRVALIASGAPGEYAPIMASYFTKVARGLFKTTDTVGRVLGRPPCSYTDWLKRNLPAILARAA
jgi:uncharacterized protein YbjT (DUF2867 family)